MIRQVLTELNSRMEKVVEGLGKDLAVIRTGRATPALVEKIMVNYHGALTPLLQLASVSTPETNLILIQPWDRTALKEIEKAIFKGINLNPQNDSNVIRVIIPPLSEERRVELAKLVSKRVEERRVMLRNIRRDGIEELRQMEKNKEISQDQLKSASKEVDELSSSFIDKINEIGQNKEREIKEV
ncbi:MAG: ribosome recycling factor [Chloroflexi bacterium CG_4_9_14_3_um_filter_45_9]|nr:MAG: ribosome recycling factor [Dehalococcoidia bacterium CG2_30_46_9]PIU23667.1 MAG: ribosome recycling factor [Chloroflexi bacterium CG08_land_8_20_14_0_20_45_12]PIX27069.1 MAG: ribosome recycling factor [Chloroflexi bacterium CG_4_8_14_3_um_filter_45_15]PJB49448.1 MAG: ribosome recycling factor [Chloroflexi bacterium CG_4_9_14_3_um_filter_45_9]